MTQEVYIYGSVFLTDATKGRKLIVQVLQPESGKVLFSGPLSQTGKYSCSVESEPGFLVVQVKEPVYLYKNKSDSDSHGVFLACLVELEKDIGILHVNVNVLTTITAQSLGVDTSGYIEKLPKSDAINQINRIVIREFWGIN